MKKTRVLTALLSLVAVMAIGLAGCSNSSQNGSNQQASFKNQTTKKADVKSTLTKSKQLWYVAGNVNAKSNSGLEAYRFNGNKVTVYNVDKLYKSYNAAKKADALSKAGTLTATFKTKGKQTLIKFKGKLSDIPMAQKFTVKKTLTGTNKSTKLKVAGYHISRNVDEDVTKAVLMKVTNN
ncbi:hypothetical protein FD30_GL001189 [Levilactobacillus namurensis DSM 19117]|uniref:Lipoprotein n=1 Tax=Levilactobacillus namurensis DSM 19117 TaxID=1423773 RepID=A0A0R1K4M3_9LACO|nr:hypothetical protein [Levilactobacillus namurensis]KRK78139.1 hypothetical protein FD30_GL001189 [Levilactobacillus namurensis DSM 19117]GEO74286.1 hypothetical protein LNA02_09840 [Levilactobacillus namurensis]